MLLERDPYTPSLNYVVQFVTVGDLSLERVQGGLAAEGGAPGGEHRRGIGCGRADRESWYEGVGCG